MYPESKAENINKLEKDLLNILSEIQTPQLHQQVILIFFKAEINVITAFDKEECSLHGNLNEIS